VVAFENNNEYAYTYSAGPAAAKLAREEVRERSGWQNRFRG